MNVLDGDRLLTMYNLDISSYIYNYVHLNSLCLVFVTVLSWSPPQQKNIHILDSYLLIYLQELLFSCLRIVLKPVTEVLFIYFVYPILKCNQKNSDALYQPYVNQYF